MKRILSLVLAILMTALMIPFSVVTSAANEAGGQNTANSTDFPFLLKLPAGWVVSRDDMMGAKNGIDANGVTLGSDTQSLAMTAKVGIGQKRVISVDFGTPSKISIINFSWEAAQPSAGNVNQANITAARGGNELLFCVFGGPEQQPISDAASFSWKVSASASGSGWMNSGSNAVGYYRTTPEGNFSTSNIRRWTIGNTKDKVDDAWGSSLKAIYDGALGTNGTKMTVYIEIDENDYVTGAYYQTVFYDAQGNFVRENVVYTQNDIAYKAKCDGYFTIGHSGWGENAAMTIKSVNINAGTAKEMGELLHSTNFQTWGAEHNNALDYVTPEKDKNYTDETATYYKDGYLLHFLTFDKVVDSLSTGYSFTNDTFSYGKAEIANSALRITNTGDKDAYYMFTGNAIPQTITEYTVKYSFRFVGENDSSFGFIRGISLDDNGSKNVADTITLTHNGEITDFTTADATWGDIVVAMKAGEWVDVTVSSVGRYVEYVNISCGGKSAAFKMDVTKNKAAVDGYMGFVIGQSTTVEVYTVIVVAGKDSSIQNYTWPTGLEMGEIVQDVTAEAVAEGTKPDYSDLIGRLNGTKVDDTIDDFTQNTTSPDVTTEATKKKGCKGSLVAVHAIIATAIFGCAVVCKKKED